ncbi:hypothetical protein TNCV_2053341 [Trichonephila clavipes]|nr:hypothetical protein TNCV_2053341 [Trichonephila clavipes]
MFVCGLDGKRRNCMTRKRVEVREGSLRYPGVVTNMFTKDSKPLEGGSNLLGKQYHALPPGGNFNIGLDKDEGLRLVQFLNSDLTLGFVFGKARGGLAIITSTNSWWESERRNYY